MGLVSIYLQKMVITFALALAPAVVSGCSFNVGNKSISARPGTRMPGVAYTQPDGDFVYSPTSELEGDGVMIILRMRDRGNDDRDSPFPKPPWSR